MLLAVRKIPIIIFIVSSMWLAASAQDVTRELNLTAGGTVDIVNRAGRVAARAEPAGDDTPAASRLTAMSPGGISESELKISVGGGRTTITVNPSDTQKRIDLMLILPERTKLRVQTNDGAIEVGGGFASIEAKTQTGTVVLDVPVYDLKYQFLWTESRPRYLADFDIAEVKEKSAGRFEIKGRKETERKQPPAIAETDGEQDPAVAPKAGRSKVKDQTSVSLNITTARGIILLNVPPNEVASDLRERPLTEAAKAIVRSGDSLLMEAIRRTSPKHFGDYSRTLPPLMLEPRFAVRSASAAVPNAAIKTALVRVTDLQNRALPGLTAADFEVVENGTTREILSISRSQAPFNLVLLLDVSGSVENYVNFIRKAARSFVDTVGKDDRVSIVIFNEDVKMLSTFTTDKGRLSESLDTFDAGGGTAYYDAIAYAVSDTLRPLKGERTAIVILTDGDDNRSFLPFDSLIGSIEESGALVYPLYVPSALIALAAQTGGADIDPTRSKYMSLTAKSEGEGERLAKISGGVYYPITQISQIQKAYEDIVIQMRTAYNVKFRSDAAMAAGNGASPRLKIRAKRENTFATVTSVIAAGQDREP